MPPQKTRRGWPGREPGYALDIGGRISDAYFRESHGPGAESKSIRQQADDWDNWMPRAGVLRGQAYAENDTSASPFGGDGSQRVVFARLRADIAAGKLDGHVLWFWASSRQTRGDIPLDILARESAEHGVVWVIGGVVINPACGKDMTNAALRNLMDKDFSYALSDAVLRGKRDAALRGLPSAVPLYGYRRVYETGAAGEIVLVKGRPVVTGDEPTEPAASVVREIFDRVEKLEPFTAIAWDLRARDIPAPRRPRKCTTCGESLFRKGEPWGCTKGHEQDLCRWKPTAVRFIATNEGYLGRRIFQAESGSPADRHAAVLDDVTAKWPPLVTERQFLAVQSVITDWGHVRWRSPRGDTTGQHPYLMVPASRCGRCGGPMGSSPDSDGRYWYKCRDRGCTAIRADWLDAWAEDRLVSWMVLLDVQKHIYSGPDDETASRARAVLVAEDENLKQLYALAREGRAGSPDLVAAQEEGIKARMDEARAVLQDQPSPLLGELFGYDVADAWVAMRRDRPDAARALMAEVAVVYVNPATRRGGDARNALDESRLEWHWNIGPEASRPRTRHDPSAGVQAGKQARAEAQQRAAELLAADPTVPDAAIGAKAGCSYGTVRRIRRQLLEAGTITEPGYRTGADGAIYRASGNGTAGSRRVVSVEGRGERGEQVAALVAGHPGLRAADVAAELGITVKCAQVHLGNLAKAGRIRRAQRGVYVPA